MEFYLTLVSLWIKCLVAAGSVTKTYRVALHARHVGGLLGHGFTGCWFGFTYRLNQLHHNDIEHALQRDDFTEDANLHMDFFCHEYLTSAFITCHYCGTRNGYI